MFHTCFHPPKHKNLKYPALVNIGSDIVFTSAGYFRFLYVLEKGNTYETSYILLQGNPLECSCIVSMKSHWISADMFPVTFSGRKRQGNIDFFAVHQITYLFI